MKRFFCASMFLLPVMIGGCCSKLERRDYHGVPYCSEGTAGTGIEYYCPELSPAAIEPAAGEQVFRKAVQK